MWAGDEARNRFYQGPVTERLQRESGIALRVVPIADVADVVTALNEKSAGVTSALSICLDQRENFRTRNRVACCGDRSRSS